MPLQPLDIHGGTGSCFNHSQKQSSTQGLTLPTSLLGERTGGAKTRKLVAQDKSQFTRESKATHASKAGNAITATSTNATMGSSASVLPPPTTSPAPLVSPASPPRSPVSRQCPAGLPDHGGSEAMSLQAAQGSCPLHVAMGLTSSHGALPCSHCDTTGEVGSAKRLHHKGLQPGTPIKAGQPLTALSQHHHGWLQPAGQRAQEQEPASVPAEDTARWPQPLPPPQHTAKATTCSTWPNHQAPAPQETQTPRRRGAG